MTLKVVLVCDTYRCVMRADKAVNRNIYWLYVKAIIIYIYIFS